MSRVVFPSEELGILTDTSSFHTLIVLHHDILYVLSLSTNVNPKKCTCISANNWLDPLGYVMYRTPCLDYGFESYRQALCLAVVQCS